MDYLVNYLRDKTFQTCFLFHMDYFRKFLGITWGLGGAEEHQDVGEVVL